MHQHISTLVISLLVQLASLDQNTQIESHWWTYSSGLTPSLPSALVGELPPLPLPFFALGFWFFGSLASCS